METNKYSDVPSYIKDWVKIVNLMKNTNTYKLALGRAILEYVYLNAKIENNTDLIIPINELAKLVLKYYWNQGFFFNIKQGTAQPAICKIIKELINLYTEEYGNYPKWWTEVEYKFKDDVIETYQRKVVNTLKENPIPRFSKTMDHHTYVFAYDSQSIILTYEQALLLVKYNDILVDLLNFKWAKLLEEWNKLTPQIALKISRIADQKIERNSHNLNKIKNIFLDVSNGSLNDFYNGRVLNAEEISIDHFIPWSFIYSDDIWNLVPTSKSNNSSKLNKLPKEDFILQLNARNEKLLDALKSLQGYEKESLELEYAINNNLVREYYYACRME